jgi:hypothetical protein
MTLDNFLVVVNIQTFLSGLIVVLSFYKWSQRTRLVRLIGMLFAISFICNFSAVFIFRRFFLEYVNIPGSVYDLTLVPMLTLIFNEALRKKYSVLFNIIAIVFVIGAMINLTLFQVNWVASPNKLATSFITIFYGVIYFYRLMKDLPTMNLTRHPMFWFNSALLIYGAGSLFLFAFLDYLINVLNNDLMIYWTFHNGLSIFHQLLIIIGISYEMMISLRPHASADNLH